MCPEPQLLSIYMDGEMPSPWKEKMESHLTECPACREKIENYRQLQHKLTGKSSVANAQEEQKLMEEAKDKVWQRLQSRQPAVKTRFPARSFATNARQFSSFGMWQRRLSIPIPAAAAAAVIIMLGTALWFQSRPAGNNSMANNDIYSIQPLELVERSSYILAAEEEIPGIIPTSDLSSVLQYLGVDRTDNIIIINLPESSSFNRSGDPAIIRAADYPGR